MTGRQGRPPSLNPGGPSQPCLKAGGAIGLERRPLESEKAFAAFRAYVWMGPERSLAKLVKLTGSNEKQLEKWSSKFGWAERVAEHTAHLARLEAEVAEGLVRAGAVDWVRRQEEQREEGLECILRFGIQEKALAVMLAGAKTKPKARSGAKKLKSRFAGERILLPLKKRWQTEVLRMPASRASRSGQPLLQASAAVCDEPKTRREVAANARRLMRSQSGE